MAEPTNTGPTADDVINMVSGSEDTAAEASAPNATSDQANGSDANQAANDGMRQAIADLRAEKRQLAQQVDTLMRQQIANQQPANEGPEVDPDVEKAVAPVVDARVNAAVGKLVEEIGPVLQYARQQMGTSEVESELPGYKENIAEEVNRMFDELPPGEQQKYNSEVGAMALASKVLQRQNDELRKQLASSSRATRAQTAPGAPPGASRAQFDPAKLDTAVAKMSREEFQALRDAIADGRTGTP